MSERMRGVDISLNFIIAGVPQNAAGSSWTKVTEFTHRVRGAIMETDFLGEDATDLDTRYDGYDLSWTLHIWDASTIDLLDRLVDLDRGHKAPPDLKIQALYNFRRADVRNRMMTFYDCYVLPGDEGFRGRKEHLEARYEAKAKRRVVVTL